MFISKVKHSRVAVLKERSVEKGPVVYWMSRDQRSEDNWALLYAQETALSREVAVAVVFCLAPAFLGATLRQYAFMLKGLKETALSLKKMDIPFYFLEGEPSRSLPAFAARHNVATIVTDFDPLRIKRAWKKGVIERVKASLVEVDAHNIVPCREVSRKKEWGAYTIRPKINRLLDEYLTAFPRVEKHPYNWEGKAPAFDPAKVMKKMKLDRTVPEVEGIKPGSAAAAARLRDFIRRGLEKYDISRNDPNKDGQSGLSPYLHFGQISAQRIALEVNKSKVSRKAKEVFLEELIVRRELSDNFCFYEPNYDSVKGFPDWARKTLDEHVEDKREYTYSLSRLENGRTHDDLWNAAQLEMVRTGKMHGYMRMYWAKKILEWTPSPERAIKAAIYLNDKYELDGRDPNGYAGIAWSIGGVHDRAWGERKVFGKVRYMSHGGCRSKFDTGRYIAQHFQPPL